MTPLFRLIREVNTSNMHWALKLRLVRSYDLPAYGNKGNPTLECIFHDKEGSRIHATIKDGILEKVKPILKEGHLYAVKNVIVAENMLKYKTTKNEYKINFFSKTNICEIFDDDFPSIMFQFKSFKDLKNEYVIDQTKFYDVIGKMVSRDAPQNREVNGRATKLIDFILEDLENNNLACTLWENFVDDMMAFLDTIGEDPVVVVLQMCRAKKIMGEVRVSNTFYITKMILNGNWSEILEFRTRMNSDVKTSTNSISTTSMSYSQTIVEELTNANDSLRTIEQIFENNEVGSFWIYGRIVCMESRGNWWYLSCKKYPKKVNVVGDKFYCEKCDHLDTTENMRFKIHVRVVDTTGNAVFLLWDRECIKLIGKTVHEINAEIENQGTDASKTSKEFDHLVDRKILFKVQLRTDQIRGFNGIYTVIKLTEDPTIVEKYCGDFFESQESDLFSKLKKN
ncbi:replication protein A 70 kDa DNA-binding subunit B-like [Henckelia pumila]|uniref:replication protein A 70 kDa DNA-binding subunit B-like n=1 Tax=Henckelia pumila TaxID=405737 RepID=UPI003C6E5ACE